MENPDPNAVKHETVMDTGAERLARFFDASVELMTALCRACGRDRFGDLSPADLTSWKRETAELSGVRWAGPV